MGASVSARVCSMGRALYMVYSWYVLGSRFGAHTRGPWENPWMCRASCSVQTRSPSIVATVAIRDFGWSTETHAPQW